MRRAIARGRVFPQSYSTDRRYGRLSLKACALFPLMWANADDQGRLCGDPEEVKYTCCPNVDHITKADIPGLLTDLEENGLIKVYKTPESAAIQLLDWWHPVLGQRPQWAYPSQYQPPDGWVDRLRYHPTPTEIITENWVPPGQFERGLPSGLGSTPKEVLPSRPRSKPRSTPEGGVPSKLRSHKKKLPRTPSISNEKERGKREEGRGNIPSTLGSDPHPRRLFLTDKDKGIYETLKENYRMRWGRVRAENPEKIIPRQLGAKIDAQLRDLAIELSGAGCEPDLMIIKQAFDEAAGAQKQSVSYVRAILFDWLGVERAHKK